MKKAIWFTRHQPTVEQIEDARKMGYEIVVTETGTRLGSLDLRENGDVLVCVSVLLDHCSKKGAVAVFGVFSTPILAQLARTSEDIRVRGECTAPNGGEGDYPCFSAWNVMRSVEGEKPTFEHRQWLGIGRINKDSCRWLK